jgi:hypothetical protein
MSYVSLSWLILPSVAVATVMLLVNAVLERALGRRLTAARAPRPMHVLPAQARLPLPPPTPTDDDAGDSMRLVLA